MNSKAHRGASRCALFFWGLIGGTAVSLGGSWNSISKKCRTVHNTSRDREGAGSACFHAQRKCSQSSANPKPPLSPGRGAGGEGIFSQRGRHHQPLATEPAGKLSGA